MDSDSRRIPNNVLADLSDAPEVQREMRRLASDIAKDARALAPSKTGNLKARGIGIQKVEDESTGVVHYIVGWTPAGWYGWLAEAGREDVPPHPHLVPAAIKHGASLAGGDL